MPYGNGTGPNGMGPRTGRGLGYCNGFVPSPGAGRGGRGFFGGFGGGYGRGLANGYGRGLGQGYGRGLGQGYGRGYGAVPEDFDRAYGAPRRLSEEEYRGVVTDEVEYLENRLKTLKAELNTPEKDSE